MIKQEKDFLDRYTRVAVGNNRISQGLYEKFNVKRGLRNADGTGVLVGLTEVGEVHGYIMDEGEKVPAHGRLRYRGYDVKDLVNGFQEDRRFGFEETVFLLLFNRLPTPDELVDFNQTLGMLRPLPPGFNEDIILKFPSKDIMNMIARCVLFTYSFDEDPEGLEIKNVLRQSIELIARFPTMVAYAYMAKRHIHDKQSLFVHAPVLGKSTAENFLMMIREDSSYTDLEAELLDLSLVLHAEHGGGNNSAFSIHLVSSAGTDTYSALGAAVGSLKGIKHGGANIKVRNMMEDIKSHISDWSDEGAIADYLEKILRKEAFDKTGLIYGMGHAVYTLSDPRAVLLKEKARLLAKEKGFEDEFRLHETIERLTPELFGKIKGYSKEICANVDFYSGFVYTMLNIPTDLFTPLFAIARVAGWSAHRVEEMVSGGRIIRPAYKSVAQRRDYPTLEQRKTGLKDPFDAELAR